MQTGELTNLLEQELTSETLREALAFIDAYELSSASSDEQYASPSSPSISSSGDTESRTRDADTPPTKGRSKDTRKRTRLTAKKELELLRLDVERLEGTLKHLKSGSLRTIPVSPAPDAAAPVALDTQVAAVRARNELETMWMDMAVRQNRRRQQSEAKNRQLKRSIAKHLKIAKYLEALLARRTHAEDREASCEPSLSDFRHLQCHTRDDELVFAHLLTRSEQLYATMDVHIEQAGLLFVNTVAPHTKRRQDPKQGTVLEMVSSTPVPFAVQQTDDAVWTGLFKGEAKSPPVLTQTHNRIITEEGLQKNYLMTFEHGDTTYDLHSRTVLRKYKESNRIVYAWTTVTVLASKGIRFSSQAMLIMEPSLTLPMNATVLKKWQRLYVDQVDETKISLEDADPLIQGVFKAQIGTTVTIWSWLENYLLVDARDTRPPCSRK